MAVTTRSRARNSSNSERQSVDSCFLSRLRKAIRSCIYLITTGLILSCACRAIYEADLVLEPPNVSNLTLWNIREHFRPVCEIDYAGQLMVAAGAAPFAALYYIPKAAIEYGVVPLVEWVWKQYVAFLKLVVRFVVEFFSHLRVRVAVVWRFCKYCCDWLCDNFLRPLLHLLVALAKCVWNWCSLPVRFVARIVLLIAEILSSTISTILSILFGIAGTMVGILGGIVKFLLELFTKLITLSTPIQSRPEL